MAVRIQNILENTTTALLIGLLLFGCEMGNDAKSSTQVGASETDAGFNLAEDDEDEDEDEEDTAAKRAMIGQAQQLKATISARYAALQAERDRQGKLTSELLNQNALGCFAEMKLTQLEILVNGSQLPRKPHGKHKHQRKSAGAGSPTTMTFHFGESIAVSNDEKTSSLFQPVGRKVVTDFADLKLKDIEYVRISKGGGLFDHERECKRKWHGGKKCKWRVYEEARVELNTLELKINGETFYKKPGIKTQLEEGKLEWRDDNFELNEAYLAIMGREDCPQQ